MPHVIVGTAGHIDHGKTALVKALTGIDADRLKEEKERGITIDIGFANLALDEETLIGFVDVPGHERFIKNMLAGIGGIDIVVLVVAADESVMPQTREHLDICSLLRIGRGLTAITKIDAVEDEIAELVELEVRDYLKPTFLGASPIVRVSSQTGEGIETLKAELGRICRMVPEKDASQIFRLPIDRCFTMKGFGSVVTGTLVSGRVQKDSEVELLPAGRVMRIRGVQVHGKPAAAASAGQRTALNLQGVEVSELERGMVLTEPKLFRPSSMIDCQMELLASVPRPVGQRKRVRVHVGTAEVMAYVTLLGQDQLDPGASCLAQIRLEQPVFVLPEDRFIIRQYSPMITIGGGRVLDGHPRKHRRRDDRVLERLKVLRDGSLAERLTVLIGDAGVGAVTLEALVGRTGVAAEAIRRELDGLAAASAIRFLSDTPPILIVEAVFSDAMERTVAYIDGFHLANPLSPGVGREELKGRLFERASPVVFQQVLQELFRTERLASAQEFVHAFGRKVTLSDVEAQIRASLAGQFRSSGLAAPSPDEVIRKLRLKPETARKIIQLMIRDGEVVKISEEFFLDRETLDELIGRLRARKAKAPRLGVGDFKDMTGISRKHAIPILEYLDRQRVTRRDGDARIIL